MSLSSAGGEVYEPRVPEAELVQARVPSVLLMLDRSWGGPVEVPFGRWLQYSMSKPDSPFFPSKLILGQNSLVCTGSRMKKQSEKAVCRTRGDWVSVSKMKDIIYTETEV